MFLKIQIDENTRRMVFEDSKATAGIVGDSNVDGLVFYLPEDSEYFEFRNAVVYVIFFDATNKSHKQVLDQVDDYSGMPKWTFDDNVLKNEVTSRVSFFLHMVISDTSGNVLKSWNTLPSNVIVYKNRDYDNQEEEATRETDIDRLAGLVTTLTEKAKTIGDVEKVLSSITGSAPKPVDTRAKMVDDGHIYLYTGGETGFTTGALYYYVDGTLTYGGVYGSYDLDTTLTESGKAADAKVVGDEIAEIKEDLSEISANVRSLKNGERTTIEWVSGGWINTAGTTVDESSITANDSWRYSITPAAEDDIFILYATGGISPRAWCFVDNSYNVLSVSAANATCSGTEVTAPANTAYAIIQDNSFTEADSYITCDIIEDVKAIENEMGGINTNLDVVSNLTSKDVKSAIFTLLLNAAFVNENDRSVEYQLLRDWSLTEPSPKGGIFYHIGETAFSGSNSGIVTDLVLFNFDRDFTIAIDFISSATGRRVFGSLKSVDGNTYGFALNTFKVICDGTYNNFAHYGDHHHRVRMVFRHTKNSGIIQVKSRSTGIRITYDESFSYTPNSNATGYLCIGRTQDGNKQFVGTIYDFTLYSGVWTDAMSAEYVEG